ncbi:ammonium transporter [Psychrobacillus lasiicapitis]|uniref:Ammonium transporter n=1 Tax=Psychrobacillus lasiicapitis TaxID=1636719 RepID=A0A544T9A9_9BACI|nr:ammonium transporter [Psychrobacillus lasiicapitis]GGA37714.1 ammonium transporter [Psychrobacillus lasiicapitis]
MTIEIVQHSIDMLWVMLGAILVFFMHAGFAMLETGFTRSKNTLNILMKNFLTVSLGAVLYFLVGFGFMFGESFFGAIGTDGFALLGRDDMGFFVFQSVFAATCATIISGAVAERMKLSSYLLLVVVMTGIIYPVVGHWIWGGGWLAKLGFIDFAGSTVVHLTGAIGAFVAAALLGPRLGKYSNGKVNVIPGHSIPLGALGVFVLWVGWFGFNGASTLAADPTLVPQIIANTLFAASAGVLSTAFYTKLRFKKLDASLTLNGALAGLVSITAGAANVSLISSILIGLLAGIIMTEGVRFLDVILKVDDPVGAIAVHGITGIWGTLAVGLFETSSGLLVGGGASLIVVQILGILAVIVWVSVTVSGFLLIVKAFSPIRVSNEEEIAGLDFVEHGSQAYELNDVFPGISTKTEGFAQRLTELGKATN